MGTRKVILVTDGDRIACQVLEQMARRIGGRCISTSAGNPTPLTGAKIVKRIKQAKHDPVLVMFDDCGARGVGQGELSLKYVARHPEIEILGVIAVASHSRMTRWARVDVAMDRWGRKARFGVDKNGFPLRAKAGQKEPRIYGDTVGVLNEIEEIPLIVGIGDIGKMDQHDHIEMGSPVTMKAIRLILAKWK
ncbi:stage V sporulation protein AE [Mechercharimyces sp. CAU 1602]|uniref:stage V sporulation protein AE n=1 Tax=Mechercharimyces sp. CAU 1602 TaxID=2973933 RepID=UPI00286803BB|nr:stage V sporulation protein AE [Mechercharimyces sp. CAU 1602]